MTALWSLIEEYGIPERIDYWANLEPGQDDGKFPNYPAWDRTEAEHVDVWNLWVELVDDFMQTLGKQPMTPAQFANVLQSGLDNLHLTRIPKVLTKCWLQAPCGF